VYVSTIWNYYICWTHWTACLYPEHTSAQNYEILYAQWNMKPEFHFSHYSQLTSCNNVKMFMKTEGVWKVVTFEILRNIQIQALPCCRSKTQDKLAEVFTKGTSRLIAKFPNNLIAKCILSFVRKAGPQQQHTYSKHQRQSATVRILLGIRGITASTSRLCLPVLP